MTPQEKGRQWDADFAALAQGKQTKGSGNRPMWILDASFGPIVTECKWTGGESYRVTRDLLDGVFSQAFGPASASQSEPMIALKFEDGPMLSIVRLETQLDWLRSPPEIIPATSNERLRATARRPSLLRG